MVLLTYTGRASRVHIGDGIVIERGRPTEVHPLLGLPFRGRRDFDVIELDLGDRLVFLEGTPGPVGADPDATAEPADPEAPRRRRHASIEPETEPPGAAPDEPADPPTPDQPKETET
jgi:hypothetical protein